MYAKINNNPMLKSEQRKRVIIKQWNAWVYIFPNNTIYHQNYKKCWIVRIYLENLEKKSRKGTWSCFNWVIIWSMEFLDHVSGIMRQLSHLLSTARPFAWSPIISASASTILVWTSAPSLHLNFPISMSPSILSRAWIILFLSLADITPYNNRCFRKISHI